MRMFGPNSIASVAYYLFRIMSIGLLLLVVYIDYAFLTNNFDLSAGRYKMDIPFTETFIHGDYQFNVILTISIIFFFSVCFFFIISNIFKALKEESIFNKKAIFNLQMFTVLNLIIGPILYVLIHFPIMNKTDFRDIHNLILHLIFGLVAFFVATIFKNGYRLQNENDLTI